MLSELQEKRITQLETYDVEAEEGMTLPPGASGQILQCVRLFLGQLNSLFPSGYAPPVTIGCNELKTSASLTWDLEDIQGKISDCVSVWIHQLFDNQVYCEILISYTTHQDGDWNHSLDEPYELITLDQACERIRSLLN
jgi:hypothetical protein